MQKQRRGWTAIALAAAIGCAYVSADEITFGDGITYSGDVGGGRPHGEGRMIWPSGASYEGGFVNGLRHGLGEYRDRDGGRYVGAHAQGQRSGHGTYTWPDGRTYTGQWRAGTRHGDGVETVPGDPHTVFRGAWREGIRHGEGVETVARGLARRCTWRWGTIVRESCSGLARENRTSEDRPRKLRRTAVGRARQMALVLEWLERSTLTAGSLGAFAPPPGVARLVIARDEDAEGERDNCPTQGRNDCGSDDREEKAQPTTAVHYIVVDPGQRPDKRFSPNRSLGTQAGECPYA